MERYYANIIEDVRDGPAFCGILYLMYRIVNSNISPLYFGITERYGRSGNLSSNLSTTASTFGRWGHGDDYHFGKIGRELRQPDRWVDELFEDHSMRLLKTPVYFGAIRWTHYDRCPCGHRVDVGKLERCLISSARNQHGSENVLNRADGATRCRCPNHPSERIALRATDDESR